MATHEVYLESAMNPHHCGYGGVMTHPVRPLPLRLFTALIVCLTLALGGCSSTSEPPKGWHTFEGRNPIRRCTRRLGRPRIGR